ncbi:7-deoxyloganetin glucosyltransferase-like protein [Tanacetum coccineum]
MGSKEIMPHAVCVPAPVQGHINPMLKLAKILHSKGFLITFVNTEFNHERLIRSRGSDAVRSLPSFRFETIPDGLSSPQNYDVTQDVPTMAKSVDETALVPFKSLLTKINASYSHVTCIVADIFMVFTVEAAKEFNIPEILFWTSGAGSLICYDQYPNLLEKGLFPLKDSSYLENGYLDTVIDFIPTMGGMRLKDVPHFIRIIYPGDEFMVQFIESLLERAKKADAIVFNTFNELEGEILDTLSTIFPPCYALGPLNVLENKIGDEALASIKTNLWKEDHECIKWLDSKADASVIYVNFGSIVVLTSQQLVEFCWGLAKSNCSFLWVIRPDLVAGENAVLPKEFLGETSDRGLLTSWCPQEQVLNHPSIGGFLTHCGWNSTIESISNGVPMICWAMFSDQQPNCWWSCNKWGIAMEADSAAKRDEIQKLVTDLMNGEKGNKQRERDKTPTAPPA